MWLDIYGDGAERKCVIPVPALILSRRFIRTHQDTRLQIEDERLVFGQSLCLVVYVLHATIRLSNIRCAGSTIS